jgi:hypothetical protein
MKAVESIAMPVRGQPALYSEGASSAQLSTTNGWHGRLSRRSTQRLKAAALSISDLNPGPELLPKETTEPSRDARPPQDRFQPFSGKF